MRYPKWTKIVTAGLAAMAVAAIPATLRDVNRAVVLATKFGNVRLADGGRAVNGRPDYVVQACEASLKRLGVEPFHEPRKWTVRQNSGGRVGRVCPYGRVQPDGEVHRSAGQGPTYVLRVRQGDDPVDAREALGRTETEQVVV